MKDEPIKDLLGNINSSLIDKLIKTRYGGDMSKIPTIDYLSAEPVPVAPAMAGHSEAEGTVSYTLDQNLPEVTAWLETIAGPNLNWLRVLLTSTTIVQGTSHIDNPIRRLLAPRCGQQVDISFEGSSPTALTVFGAARSYDVHKPSFKAIEIKFNAASSLIDVTICEDRRDIAVPLFLQFQYRPSMAWTPIHENTDRRNTRIKQFYWKLWYGDDEELPDIGVRETFTGPEITIEADVVERFCAGVENEDGSFKSARNADMKAPMDFAIVTGWQVCARHSSFLALR